MAQIPNPPFNVKDYLTHQNGGRTEYTYRENHIVFSQGETADSVFYIHQGKVKITVLSEHGKEAIIAVHGPEEFFGEGCLTGHPLRLASAVTMTTCQVVRLEKRAMISVLHEEPTFSEFFVSYLLARTVRVEADLVDQLFNSSEKRLARTLLLLANFGKEDRMERAVTKVDQQMLADMIGTTRSRVNSFMNKFRKLGYIEYNGELLVRTSLLNVVLHDQPQAPDESAPPV